MTSTEPFNFCQRTENVRQMLMSSKNGRLLMQELAPANAVAIDNTIDFSDWSQWSQWSQQQ